LEINICFAGDNKFAQHIAVVIASIIQNSSKNNFFNFYILTDGFNQENINKIDELKKLKNNCSITYPKIDKESFSNCYLGCDWTNIATYYRLAMGSLLPSVDKALYLDADIVVIDDIAKLFSEDIEDYYAAGSDDVHCYFRGRGDEGEMYANAGILLLNLKKIREDRIEEKFFEFISKNNGTEFMTYQDQDVINFVLNPKIKRVEAKWNMQTVSFEKYVTDQHPLGRGMSKFANKPSIIHYTGREKPWKDYDCHHSLSYLKYLQYTPFKTNIDKKEFIVKNFKLKIMGFLRHPLAFMQDKISILPLFLDYRDKNWSK